MTKRSISNPLNVFLDDEASVYSVQYLIYYFEVNFSG